MSARASSPNSEMSYDNKKKVSPESKKKGTKKRKKKGANEPQRPVSAYALFFRDTQAAIKAQNSSATFGEISKIVASMWDSLSEEAKQVYKQKTETAKRDYLKHLAAFRANMISKGNIDADEEDLQPLSVLREKMAEQRTSVASPCSSNNSNSSVIDLTESEDNFPPLPKLQLAPGVTHPGSGIQLGEPQIKLHQINVPMNSNNSNTSQIQQSLPRAASPSSTLTKIIVPGQNGAQSTIHLINSAASQDSSSMQQTSPVLTPMANAPLKHIVLRPMTSTSDAAPSSAAGATQSPPPPIQLRNIVSHQSDSTIKILPSKPGQIIKVLPQSGGVTFASLDPEKMKGRVIKMVNVVRPIRTPSPALSSTQQDTQQTSQNTKQPDHTPILQLLAQETSVMHSQDKLQREPRILLNQIQNLDDDNEVDGNTLMQIPQQNFLQTEQPIVAVEDVDQQSDDVQDVTPRRCVREGCKNLAVSCPYWDNEYCSNECVYSHCRDVFDAWVSTRQISTSVV